MVVLHFRDLPTEVLAIICGYVDDVLNFGLINRACLSISAPRRFSRVKLFYSTPEVLYADTKRLESILKKASAFHQVHIFEVRTSANSADKYDFARDPDNEDQNIRWQFYGGHGIVVAGSEHDQIWQPVANLIQSLPNLTDVCYSCKPQLTVCLLNAIESKLSCRLQLESFHLRSLHKPYPKPAHADSYDQRLSTSPCLNSIVSRLFERIDDDGRVDYIEDAAKSMAHGFAPNLKGVSMYRRFGDGTMERSDAYRRPRQLCWDGTELGSKMMSGRKGSLESLELNGDYICRLRNLRSWTTVTDFSMLKTLRIWHNVSSESLKLLYSKISLTSLQSVLLGVTPGINDDRYLDTSWEETKAEFLKDLISFFSTVPSLQRLYLQGEFDYMTIGQIMQYHGTTLQKLVLSPAKWSDPFGDAYIINVNCQQQIALFLRDLTITMLRSDGDRNEVRQYKWLGSRFPNLRRLKLSLDCRHLGPILEDKDEQSSQDGPHIHRFPKFYPFEVHGDHDRSGIEPPDDPKTPENKTFDLRYVLRNHAIDSTLAEAIFNKIAASKPIASPALESLKLFVLELEYKMMDDGYGNPALPPDFFKVCWETLGKSWHCTLDLGDLQRPRLVTKEILSDSRKTSMKDNIDKTALHIFHSQWPKQIDKEWYECWHSYPLAIVDSELGQ